MIDRPRRGSEEDAPAPALLAHSAAVSSPCDPLELEAHHAAPFMLGGRPATLSIGTGLVRGPQRDVDLEMLTAARQAEQDVLAHPPRTVAAGIANVDDVHAAERLSHDVEAQSGALAKAVADGSGSPDQQEANESVISQLRLYFAGADRESSSSAQFQAQCQRLTGDYARLDAQFETLRASSSAMDGSWGADNLIRGAGSDPALVEKEADAIGHDEAIHQLQLDAELLKHQLEGRAEEVGGAQGEYSKAEGQAVSAARALVGLASGQSCKEYASELAAVKGAAARIPGAIAAVAASVTSRARTASAGMDEAAERGQVDAPLPLAGTHVGTGPAGDGATQALVAFVAAYNRLNGKAQLDGYAKYDGTSGLWDAYQQVAQAHAAMSVAGNQYLIQVKQLAAAQVRYRKQLRLVGEAMDRKNDKPGGHTFRALAGIVGEADSYLAQAQATLDIGKNAKVDAAVAHGFRRGAEGGAAMIWYAASPVTLREGRQVRKTFAVSARTVTLSRGGKTVDAEAAIEQAMDRLELQRGQIQRMVADCGGTLASRHHGQL